MGRIMNRRSFMAAGAGAGAGALAARLAGEAGAAAPQVIVRGARPVVIASGNGHESKDAQGRTCVQLAFELMTKGADVLDALVAGVNIVELDPEETSVGYGGLPNADGVVQLDASVMHGPRRAGGAVACLEGVRTPSSVAKKVMEETDHVLLVGKDAQTFARNMGFEIEADLNTPKSRRLWLEWKRRTDPEHYLSPKARAEAGVRAAREMMEEGLIDPNHYWGTINCDGCNSRGEVCGVTTTSGLAWKIPGRVGDSPILGAGLYVDGDIGAAGSTGRGEANLLSLASFLVVESMRQGMSPKDAGMTALRRICSMTIQKRLLNDRGEPNFGISFYAVNVKGEYAGVTLRNPGGGAKYAVCTEDGPRSVPLEPLLEG
jgi:N4-(beta-N-acetylglucosaminyl)-L-asparaginase